MHKHRQHAHGSSIFTQGCSLKEPGFVFCLKKRTIFPTLILLFQPPSLVDTYPRAHRRTHTHTCAHVHTHEENFNFICRGRNQSHISLVNPQWLSTDPDTNKVLSRWGQGLRRRTEREERPVVWGLTGGWHRSSAIMGLVYGRVGWRKEAAEIEGQEREREATRERGMWKGVEGSWDLVLCWMKQPPTN